MKTFLSDYKWKKVYNKLNWLLWEITWVLFDIDYEKVVGFIYKKSFLNYQAFLFKNILKENEDWFLIKETKKIHDFYEIIWKNVKNEDFEHLWYIEDVEFDFNYKIKDIIVDFWYSFLDFEVISKTKINIKKDIRKISKKSILSYEKDFIVIKDKNVLKENKKTLENISKIFINIKKPSYNINQ